MDGRVGVETRAGASRWRMVPAAWACRRTEICLPAMRYHEPGGARKSLHCGIAACRRREPKRNDFQLH